jgi:hypothetical protein
VAHRHLKAGLGRKPSHLGLPGPHPVAVGPARIAQTSSRSALGYSARPACCHQRRSVATANAAVSWSVPTLTQPALAPLRTILSSQCCSMTWQPSGGPQSSFIRPGTAGSAAPHGSHERATHEVHDPSTLVRWMSPKARRVSTAKRPALSGRRSKWLHPGHVSGPFDGLAHELGAMACSWCVSCPQDAPAGRRRKTSTVSLAARAPAFSRYVLDVRFDGDRCS